MKLFALHDLLEKFSPPCLFLYITAIIKSQVSEMSALFFLSLPSLHTYICLFIVHLFASVSTCTYVGGCGLQKRVLDLSELESQPFSGQKGCGMRASIQTLDFPAMALNC